MGLDMHLIGEKYLPKTWNDPSADEHEDGFRVQRRLLELGYWRKHPDLHGFIVQSFAEGKDECQRIELSAGDLKRIIEAVAADDLPKTEGFFFGESQPEYKVRTIEILTKALEWLEARKDDKAWSSVFYRASW